MKKTTISNWIYLLTIISIFILSKNYGQNKKLHLKVVKEEASCTDYDLFDGTQNGILPENILQNLTCATIADFTNGWLTYENKKNEVRLYQPATKTDKLLFTNYADINGFSGPFWSPSKNKIAFTIVNQSQNHGYQTPTRLIILTIDQEGNIEEKQKYDINLFFECGSICTTDKVTFLDDYVVAYTSFSINQSRLEKHIVLDASQSALASDYEWRNGILMWLNEYDKFNLDKNGYIAKFFPSDNKQFQYLLKIGTIDNDEFKTIYTLYADIGTGKLYQKDTTTNKLIEVTK